MEEENQKQISPNREINQYFNVTNAKRIALCLVMGFILYHSFIHLKYGSDSCQWLLADGSFQGYNAWQPYGCMMHSYENRESINCMHYLAYWGKTNHIVFLGDSRIRQLYYRFISLMSHIEVPSTVHHANDVYHDKKINLRIDFIWEPMVDESMTNVFRVWHRAKETDRPTLVITGSATWSIKVYNRSVEGLEHFRVNLSQTVPYFDKINDTTRVIWMLQDPVVEQRLSPNRSAITNSEIDSYNRAAVEILSTEQNSARIWASSRLVAWQHVQHSEDGLHVGNQALDWDVQMLMNMYCNQHMNFHDGTCCSGPEAITTVQLVTAVFFGTLMVVTLLLWVRQRRHGLRLAGLNHVTNPVDPPTSDCRRRCSDWCDGFFEVSSAFCRLGLIMAFFFLCDRTSFFMKENKHYTHMTFFLPFAYLMILGFFFTDKTEQTSVLHRDQTDEWKGWMQISILVYHLTGASKVLPIYMLVRVLVSSYLFLTGFGHFTYFWNTSDYSFYRVCKVLFRLNFLVLMLCFVMNRPYQFYYYVPLVSFWFLLIYVAMAIWPQVSATSADGNPLHYLYILIKLGVLVTISTLLYTSESFFEDVFLVRPLKALFVTSDDSIKEWRFRWKLDRYVRVTSQWRHVTGVLQSAVFGMLFALVLYVGRRVGVVRDSGSNSVFSRSASWLTMLLGAGGLATYFLLTGLCRTKAECNEMHPFIAFVPAVCYVFLRNVPGWLRARYSSFFAWFGRIALELFIGQYHVWLAKDTHGTLVFVPQYPVLNVCLTSYVFVCVAHELHQLTAVLSPYVVPQDCRLLVRNAVVALLVLLPIAYSHGVLGSLY